MNIQQSIFKFIVRSNWILLLAASSISLLTSAPDFTKGIISGGLIVTINFHLMHRSLKKTLTPPNLSSFKSIIARYYARFTISVIIIFILVTKNYVNPGGLLIGLSIVVTSILISTLLELKKIIFKEAA